MRRYKLSEILDARSASGYDMLLLNTTYSTIILNVMHHIKDTDGEPVDTTLYNWVTDYFDRGSSNQNTRAAGWYYDRAYASKFGDLVTVKKFDSADNALDYVQEMSASILLRECDNLARLYYSLNLPYNPLYNKDATETLTQSGTITDTHTGEDDIATIGTTQDASTSTSSGKRDGQTLMESKVTVEESTVPYNNTTHYDIDKSETTTPVMGTDGTATNSVDYHNTTDYDSSIEHAYDKTDTKRSFGNLGITKSTDLLESEFSMRQKNSFWRYVYDLCLKDQLMREVTLCEY